MKRLAVVWARSKVTSTGVAGWTLRTFALSVPIDFKIGRYERPVKAKHLKVRVDASGEFDTISPCHV